MKIKFLLAAGLLMITLQAGEVSANERRRQVRRRHVNHEHRRQHYDHYDYDHYYHRYDRGYGYYKYSPHVCSYTRGYTYCYNRTSPFNRAREQLDYRPMRIKLRNQNFGTF